MKEKIPRKFQSMCKNHFKDKWLDILNDNGFNLEDLISLWWVMAEPIKDDLEIHNEIEIGGSDLA